MFAFYSHKFYQPIILMLLTIVRPFVWDIFNLILVILSLAKILTFSKIIKYRPRDEINQDPATKYNKSIGSYESTVDFSADVFSGTEATLPSVTYIKLWIKAIKVSFDQESEIKSSYEYCSH